MAQINLKNTDTPQNPPTGKTGLFVDTSNSPILITDDGTQIPLGGTSLDQAVIDALNAGVSPTGENPFITLSQLQEVLGKTTGILYGGSVQWSGTGLVFNVSTTGYFLDGLFYEEPAGQVTLATADATNDRIDVFIVNSTGFDKITGTPSATPVKPTIDPVTQIELSFVTIEALATEPTITNENVYLENAEWTTSSAGTGTFNPDSTTDPFAGTKSFEATNVQNGGQMIFTRSSDIDLTNYITIGLQVKLKNTMNNGRNIFVQFFDNSDNPLTNSVAISIVKSNTSSYQFASINLNSFTFSSLTTVRKIKLTYNGSGGASTYDGFFIDNVILQFGIQNSLSPYFTNDEINAVKEANSPSASNPFATIADLSGISYPEASYRENNTVLFDNDYITGINAAARSGNILFDFTSAKLGATTQMRHYDASAFTFPTGAVLMFDSADISTTADNYFLFVLVDKTSSAEIVHVFHAMEGGVA